MQMRGGLANWSARAFVFVSGLLVLSLKSPGNGEGFSGVQVSTQAVAREGAFIFNLQLT